MTADLSDEIDTAVAAFEERITSLVNDGLPAVMVLIGHRTRLFDTMAVPAPSTIDQIAAQTGLQDHYVREWLATTAAGRREPLESGIGGGFGAFDDHVCRLG